MKLHVAAATLVLGAGLSLSGATGALAATTEAAPTGSAITSVKEPKYFWCLFGHNKLCPSKGRLYL